MIGFVSLVVLVLRRSLIIMLFLLFIFGALRYLGTVTPPFVSHPTWFKSALTARLISFPSVTTKNQHLTVEVTAPFLNAAPLKKFKILIIAPLQNSYDTGDTIVFRCQYWRPVEDIRKNYYHRWLWSQDIRGVCYAHSITVTGNTSSWQRIMSWQRHFMISRLQRTMHEPQTSLLTGIMVGDDAALPRFIEEAFQKTGTSHLLAISGYNISVVIMMLNTIFPYFGIHRRKSFSIIVVFILWFVMLTGASPSVVRAGIMGLLTLMSYQLGRPRAGLNFLFLAAAGMVFLQPRLLLFNLGFQFSFLSTFALLWFLPRFPTPSWAHLVPAWLWNNIATTLSVLFVTWPLTLFSFREFHPVAVLANLFLLPVVPIIMVFGFLTFMCSIFSFTIARIVATINWIFLEYMIEVVLFFRKHDLFAVSLARPFVAYLFVVFIFILCIFILKRKV